MSKRPQFSLKAILVIIAVLAVPLAMMVSGQHHVSHFGYYTLFVVGGSSLGYLLGGWKYAFKGMAVGALAYTATLIASRLG